MNERWLRVMVSAAMLGLLYVPTLSAQTEPGLTQANPVVECCDLTAEPGVADQQLCDTGFACCASGAWQCNDALGISTCASTGVACGPRCCDPTAEPGLHGNQPCVEGASCCASGEWQCNDATGGSTCAVDGATCLLQCCDPLEEPGQFGNLPCVEGATCCSSGAWQCNDAGANSTCAVDSVVCQECCDPLEEPGQFGNPVCVEGATCCSSGDWQCNDEMASSSCLVDGIVCQPRCCDPLEEPGQFGNTPCVEGSTCCAGGDWRCNDEHADSTCAVDGLVCDACCDRSEQPGRFGNPPCFEGATCCSTGDWQCNDEMANSTCLVDGPVCAACCDPLEEPGQFGNPVCVEGATCCSSGDWQCNDEMANSTCAIDGNVCQPQCCDPFEEPGQFGNPVCFEGASCCSTGEWQCNDEAANSTCAVDGAACDRCCDDAAEPGRFGNPPCFEGATCCSTGDWQCNDEMGSSSCDVDGLACAGCCAPAEEPGQFGNPPCFEGATCCSTGEWQCNDEMANSTCAIDGAVCEPRCCDPTLQPNLPGNPFCSTGFECCADGHWLCHDAAGLSTCPGDVSDACPRICGGIAGIPCDDGEFCRFDVGECCCDFFGVCTPIPEVCPLVFDPVCACDGVTYSNECEAAAAGLSIDHPGPCEQVCGGIAGIPCDEGQFCNLPLGECCCDVLGTCLPIPEACPAVCDPVCGCDGMTYGNRCEAAAASASIDHPGPCTSGGGLVEGVRFSALGNMRWAATPEALGYNLYKKVVTTTPPLNFGDCLSSGLTQPVTPIPGIPAPGRLWLLQVTAIFDSGEGPMGIGSQCNIRRPAARCTCSLPPDVGPCDGVFPRWFHNFLTGQCEPFVWGGCEGNANNFETLEECQAACVDPCTLPADVGPCDGIFPRWFYNSLNGQCEEFIWGGCGGNANNYETRIECAQACVCSLPPDPGPCEAAIPRWFHNVNSAACELFTYGGCEGNANNFETEAECAQVCLCDPADVVPCDVIVPTDP